jgi:integrase
VVRALTLQEVVEVREAVRAWQDPAFWRLGPRHSSVLADMVDVLLATGGRIGEVLALRWRDLDRDADPPTVTFA